MYYEKLIATQLTPEVPNFSISLIGTRGQGYSPEFCSRRWMLGDPPGVR